MLIASIGLTMMYAAGKGSMQPWGYKQLIYFVVTFIIMFIIALTDIKIWFKYAYLFYGFSILLLVLVEIKGHTAMGATRWIDLKFIKLQPSEISKLSLVFALSKYFHNLNYNQHPSIISLFVPLMIIFLPFGLIIHQPDLGTAMILLFVGGLMFFIAGVRLWLFAAVLIIAISVFPIVWKFVLHDYQKKRIEIFLDPEKDPLGSGYNIIQSKIAIGSGGVSGKGLLNGSQSQLSFLPEHQTDFIFTMLSEELGFIGGVSILILYLIIFIYGVKISLGCKNHFGRLLSLGITSIIFFHVFINIAMVMGMIPVVGVPLPLLTYGGTITMSVLVGIGLILSVKVYSNLNIGQGLGGL
jgi:rod shape determining protein RodA